MLKNKGDWFFSAVVPNLIDTRDKSCESFPWTGNRDMVLRLETSLVEEFSLDREQGHGFEMIQAHHIYCALYFYYY